MSHEKLRTPTPCKKWWVRRLPSVGSLCPILTACCAGQGVSTYLMREFMGMHGPGLPKSTPLPATDWLCTEWALGHASRQPFLLLMVMPGDQIWSPTKTFTAIPVRTVTSLLFLLWKTPGFVPDLGEKINYQRILGSLSVKQMTKQREWLASQNQGYSNYQWHVIIKNWSPLIW
jgi:hypothetical protein